MTIENQAFGEISLGMLDGVMQDPKIREIVDKAKLYNQLLATEPVKTSQVEQIIRELDADWHIFYGEEATVTGRLVFKSDEGELFTANYIDHTMISDGFIAAPIDDHETDENGLIANIDGKEIKYEVRLRFFYERIARNNQVVNSYGTAKLCDIYSLEFDGLMTDERAQAWLAYHCPDAIEEIDVACLNKTVDECEIVMRLKESTCDLSNSVHGTDEKDLADATMALNLYTSSLFDFDSEMPYQLTIDGHVWTFGDNEGVLVPGTVQNGTTYVTVDAVVWTNRPREENTVLSPHLSIICLSDDKDKEGIGLLVPVSSVSDFKSLRRLHFGPLRD